MKYHAGLRIFYTLFRLALHDILEFSVFILGVGVLLGATVFGVFILSGGNPLFTAFGSGLGAMTRLSFGFLDYSEFVSESNGLGDHEAALVLFFWVSVLLLVLVVQNTLLAVGACAVVRVRVRGGAAVHVTCMS
ncbi:hypothetical protein GPECTOR_54g222 [Gonium pectorale]|uniref:Polycystin cation channel PKD1/PKD2 domain-containing protein n=1 Tax=Gonium pectorale TaxID=33097 RepID=A0A150G6N0_GONPE|nr:hypothetical protein GPECTOR_54g222 [Gonium pectorale]|eukprot:KXZ45481.1 hypothetical protein GPECTOR_54g222 [Gonium pectorale]